MDKPGGNGANKKQMMIAKVLGSEEEAKKKIYNVSCERYFGFRCEIDEETSNKIEGSGRRWRLRRRLIHHRIRQGQRHPHQHPGDVPTLLHRHR